MCTLVSKQDRKREGKSAEEEEEEEEEEEVMLCLAAHFPPASHRVLSLSQEGGSGVCAGRR